MTHFLFKDICSNEGCCLCPGGDAGACLEAGCPEYGIFHSTGVAERHGLTAVRQLPAFKKKKLLAHCSQHFWAPCCVFFALSHVFQACPSFLAEQVANYRACLKHSSAVDRCDSTERLRNSLDYLRSVLNDSTSFKLIYRYAFDFARVSQATFVLAKMLTQALSKQVHSHSFQ